MVASTLRTKHFPLPFHPGVSQSPHFYLLLPNLSLKVQPLHPNTETFDEIAFQWLPPPPKTPSILLLL